MPPIYTYPVTINDREFLLGVAAYPVDGVSVPDLLAVKGLADDAHAVRAMYQTAAHSIELKRVERFINPERPRQIYRQGTAALYLYRLTEKFAPYLLDIALEEQAQATAAIEGLHSKFYF